MGQIATFDHAEEPSARIAARLRTWPQPAVAGVIAIAGFGLLTALLVGMGLIITSSSLSGSIGSWDESVSRWFELHRTPVLNTWTDIGSILAGTGTVLGIVGLSVAVMLIRRLWYSAGFLVIGLLIEITVFLSTTMIVDRPRPNIEPLDPLPITSSFPSGHVAAAIVMYLGIAFLISSHNDRSVVRVGAWIIGILLPIWVGLARIYRGMHHPTDVAASIILGVAALAFAALAVRSAAAVAERRRRRPIETRSLPEPSEVRT